LKKKSSHESSQVLHKKTALLHLNHQPPFILLFTSIYYIRQQAVRQDKNILKRLDQLGAKQPENKNAAG
jgi:hypothetical protein